MQMKSARGVQQEDVAAAADALIGEGLRPTIERVRQKIGRGSPNTVSPLLDAWFAALGERLGGPVQADDSGFPAVVQEAMGKLWGVALSASKTEADRMVSAQMEAIAGEKDAILHSQLDLAQRESLFAQRQIGMEQAVAAAEGQIAELKQRLADGLQELRKRDASLMDSQSRLLAAENLHRGLLQKLEATDASHGEAMQKQEERFAATERRLLLDIDRLRQEAKDVRVAAERANRRLQDLVDQNQAESQQLSTAWSESKAEIQSLQVALASASERNLSLQDLLQQQKDQTQSAVAQLNGFVVKSRRRVAMKSLPKKTFRKI